MAEWESPPSAAQHVRRFIAALPDEDVSDLLPAALCRSLVQALGVSGAALGLIHGRYRVPLGASDDTAALVESLQFTFGAGPCLDAATRREPVIVLLPELRTRWPALAYELQARTPYVGGISIPVSLPEAVGAIDLFVETEAQLHAIRLSDALDATAEVAGVLRADFQLSASLTHADPERRPSLLRTGPARSRGRVWLAIGLVMVRTNDRAHDALARLRAFAYAQGRSIDDVAGCIVDGTQDLAAIVG